MGAIAQTILFNQYGLFCFCCQILCLFNAIFSFKTMGQSNTAFYGQFSRFKKITMIQTIDMPKMAGQGHFSL